MGGEWLDVFCLMNEEGIIHIPKPDPRGAGGSTDVPGFKFLHKQATKGLAGDPMATPYTCL